MDKIEHKFIEVNGLKLHVAEITGGNGSQAVFFCHGFPEIWYSWRHQMIAVANAGYTAIAPDCRGYGLSDPKPGTEKTTYADFISDVYFLLDVLGISMVLVHLANYVFKMENHFFRLSCNSCRTISSSFFTGFPRSQRFWSPGSLPFCTSPPRESCRSGNIGHTFPPSKASSF